MNYQTIINQNRQQQQQKIETSTFETNEAGTSILSSLGLTPSLPLTNSIEPKYFKISKEELFGGLIPPTMFETSSLTTGLATSNPVAFAKPFGTN